MSLFEMLFDNASHIMPLFFLICLGYFARKTVLTSERVIGLNQFVYFFALPALMFTAAANQPVAELFNLKYIAAFLLAVALLSLITYLGSYYGLKQRNRETLVLHGLNTVFANYAYMGTPLVLGIVGPQASGPMIAIILTGNIVLVCGAQLLIESMRSTAVGWAMVWDLLSRSLLRNPMFMAIMAGIFVAATELQVPSVIDVTLNMLAPAAVPVALFALGASMTIGAVGTIRLELTWLITLKLIFHPLITWAVMSWMGIEQPQLILTAVILTALPTGALVHVVASRYQCYVGQSALIVVLSTLLSLMTVTLWLTIAQSIVH